MWIFFWKKQSFLANLRGRWLWKISWRNSFSWEQKLAKSTEVFPKASSSSSSVKTIIFEIRELNKWLGVIFWSFSSRLVVSSFHAKNSKSAVRKIIWLLAYLTYDRGSYRFYFIFKMTSFHADVVFVALNRHSITFLYFSLFSSHVEFSVLVLFVHVCHRNSKYSLKLVSFIHPPQSFHAKFTFKICSVNKKITKFSLHFLLEYERIWHFYTSSNIKLICTVHVEFWVELKGQVSSFSYSRSWKSPYRGIQKLENTQNSPEKSLIFPAYCSRMKILKFYYLLQHQHRLLFPISAN